MTPVAVDTGPIVALLNARDRHHAWACKTFSILEPPLLSCEAVLAEACHLLSRLHGGSAAALALLAAGVIEIHFDLASEIAAVKALMTRYDSVPMSLADASLVRIAELDARTQIVTLDSDFRIYRRAGRHALKVMMPEESN